MPASEGAGVAERTLNFAAGGAAVGGALGLGSAFWNKPAPGTVDTVVSIGRTSAGHAGMLAAMAGVFAATDTLLDQTRGHSPVNSAAAGCAAGAVVGFRQGDPQRAAFGCVLFALVQGFGTLGQWSSGGH